MDSKARDAWMVKLFNYGKKTVIHLKGQTKGCKYLAHDPPG